MSSEPNTTENDRNPLISIVLPVYNGEPYLESAVGSCLTQTYGRFELIIVDDGSTDGSAAFVEEAALKDARIHLVRHEANAGLPAALNTGFRVAQGELLTWTSHDNCYHPDALAVMADFLKNRPDVDVVYTDSTLIDEHGRPLRKQSAPAPDGLAYFNVVGACFLFRRRVWSACGSYDEALFGVEDYEYWLRAADKGFRFVALRENFYRYRVHPLSLSTQRERRIKLLTRKLLEEYVAVPNRSADMKCKAFLRLAGDAAALGERSRAAGYFLKAMRSHPAGIFCLKAAPAIGMTLLGRSGYERVRDILGA